MKTMIDQLPNPDKAWQTFLEFDAQISQTILQECQANNIAICNRSETESVAKLAQRVAQALGM